MTRRAQVTTGIDRASKAVRVQAVARAIDRIALGDAIEVDRRLTVDTNLPTILQRPGRLRSSVREARARTSSPKDSLC